MKRDPGAGFTLIETLVALAVLAVSSLAFLGATRAHVARVGALETRAAAMMVAQNYLAEVTLGLEPDGRADMLGISFEVRAERKPTADPDLQQIDIAVADAASGVSYARLTGFVLDGGNEGP